MRRRSKPLAYVLGIIISGFICFGLLHYNWIDDDHAIIKRSIHRFEREKQPLHVAAEKQNQAEIIPGEAPPPEAQPGQLICDDPRTERLLAAPADEEEPILPPEVERPARGRAIVTGWTNNDRFIGCCPPGDRNGRPYRSGMACCVEELYNATMEFCCLSKAMKLKNTEENRMFCGPPDRELSCKVEDLGLDLLRPLDVECRYEEGKDLRPRMCVFTCPPGSEVRGDKTVECTEQGTWSDAYPQCCEGCPPSFTHDIWFVVETNANIGVGNLASILTFFRRTVGFLPISQSQVRVAATVFNRELFNNNDRDWFLDRYNNSADLSDAINNLPRDGNGRNTRAALEWVANNTFQGRLGDRPEVENLVVLLTTGSPDDRPLGDVGARVQELSRVIVFAIGPNATSNEIRETASPPANRNYFRVNNFQDLDAQNKFLYDIFCQQHCLSP